MNFSQLKLDPGLLRGIAERGYTEMTPVQEQTLSQTLQGKDAAVQSQTGTGKTAAFLVTIFERRLQGSNGRERKPLIIVPTRELAVQIEGEAKLLKPPPGLHRRLLLRRGWRCRPAVLIEERRRYHHRHSRAGCSTSAREVISG